MNRYIIIAGLIALSIATTLLTNVISYKNAERAADDFLRAEALGISSSLDSTIGKYGTRDNIFSEIIQSEQWEGIAFLALYGEEGSILLHSNKNLVGKRSEDADIREAFRNADTHFYYKMLGTGEDVFIMDAVLQFGGSQNILRVALHPYPAHKIVREARLQIWSTIVVISVLLIITAFFLISMKKREGLEKALAEKEKLSLLGEMSAVLAHEIRNPLGSIKGFAQYLREKTAKGLDEDDAPYFDVIVSESRRLERLTEDLLSYAREDTLRPETFNLALLITDALSSFAIPLSVTVNNFTDGNIVLTTDREKLRQIMINLMQNALDALPEGGSVIIRAQELDKSISLSIEDTGKGIDEKTRLDIFKPFFSTKTKGTGLGLAIVDRYVRTLGGKITVASTTCKGSIFTLVIPG